jgi:hypothetical protein
MSYVVGGSEMLTGGGDGFSTHRLANKRSQCEGSRSGGAYGRGEDPQIVGRLSAGYRRRGDRRADRVVLPDLGHSVAHRGNRRVCRMKRALWHACGADRLPVPTQR